MGCCTAHPATALPLRPSKHPPPPLRQAGTNDVAVRPDGRLFACAGWDGRARLYTLRKRQEPLAVLKVRVLGKAAAASLVLPPP